MNLGEKTSIIKTIDFNKETEFIEVKKKKAGITNSLGLGPATVKFKKKKKPHKNSIERIFS